MAVRPWLLTLLAGALGGLCMLAAARRAAAKQLRERLAVLTHDVRAPLAVVRGEVELVLADPDTTPAERARSADEALDGLDRATNILSEAQRLAGDKGPHQGSDEGVAASMVHESAAAQLAPSRRRGTLSVGLLLTRHPSERVSPIMPEVVRLLEARGSVVEVIYPDERLTDLGRLEVSHDLYVLKSGTDGALSLAGALHDAGASVLNPYPVAAACRDKIILTQALRRSGAPLPDTFAAGEPTQLEPLLAAGPIVVKPYRGSQGRGVRVVREIDELGTLAVGDGPLFAQRFCEPKGRDRKLYRIGEQVFGVKRVWPVRSYQDKLGEPFAVSDELRDIALRCGAAFGIDLYGLDVVETDDGPYVVDFSSFPGFKGVPDAAHLLADYVWEAAERARAGVPDFAAPGSALAAG